MTEEIPISEKIKIKWRIIECSPEEFFEKMGSIYFIRESLRVGVNPMKAEKYIALMAPEEVEGLFEGKLYEVQLCLSRPIGPIESAIDWVIDKFESFRIWRS